MSRQLPDSEGREKDRRNALDRQTLKEKLDELGVNPSFYSLEGSMWKQGIVLYQSYDKWIVYELDERGPIRPERTFYSENDACQYIYESFLDKIKIFGWEMLGR